jgi:GDPmannose 4,6-dehydratase
MSGWKNISAGVITEISAGQADLKHPSQNNMARAFITGIAGQDGSYLAEMLLGSGYQVHGLVLPGFVLSHSWLSALEKHLGTRLFIHTGDMNDPKIFPALVVETRADEVYHLAGQTHVLESFNDPEGALELNARATVRLLEAARRMSPPPRIFHASSSEIFGSPTESPQDEHTPVNPQNPYACAKAFSSQMLAVYRQTYGLFAVNGILFPHESPRRDEKFGTRRICRAAAAIKLGRQTELRLGDLAARRDWTDARDVVRGMGLALQQATAEDFVFASGELHSVQELVEVAFNAVGLDWKKFVRPDENYARPADARRIMGNAAKAKRLLGWEPRRRFAELFEEMVRTDLERLQAA